jgi:hypothetical protein
MLGGARAHPGDGALEHGEAGQQHLGGHQPRNRPVEQRRRPVGTGPAERVEEPVEPEGDAAIGELAVAVALADTRAVPPAARAGR